MKYTNCPGHNWRSVFGNVPLTLIVPVVGSTALSMKLMRPVDGLPLSVGAIALAGSVPCAAMKRLSAGSCPSGTEKETYTGVTLLIVTIVWVSCARTRLPGWTCSKPVRPDIGALPRLAVRPRERAVAPGVARPGRRGCHASHPPGRDRRRLVACNCQAAPPRRIGPAAKAAHKSMPITIQGIGTASTCG